MLGHLQQGGDPQPFDRILAARMVARAIEFLDEKWDPDDPEPPAIALGHVEGEVRMTPMEEVMRMANTRLQRPRKQWWMRLRPIARMMAWPN